MNEYEDLMSRRFAFVNVWRNIADYPIMDTPLAVMNAQTLDYTTDIITLDFQYVDQTMETYMAAYSPRQEWVYYPAMIKEEALLLKTYDSQGAAWKDDPNYPPYHRDEDLFQQLLHYIQHFSIH
jgi:hypothetical protein